MDVKGLLKKYKDVIAYLFFGACTTLVNVIVYWIGAYLLGLGITVSTIVAWIMAVLFAYVTNRKWVFHSKAHNKKEIYAEILSFFLARLATGILDWVCMYIFVDVLKWNDMLIKILSNILVIIFNYVASKLVVFRKK